MIYLLGQIALCLVLAVVAGWYVGWTWRGFRESDRVEDLRHTLRATEEVKERELAESTQRADALESGVDTLHRRIERLADEITAMRRGDPRPAPEERRQPPGPSERRPYQNGGPRGPEATPSPGALRNGASEHGPRTEEGDRHADQSAVDPVQQETFPGASVVEHERARRQAAEQELALRNAEVLELEAELVSHRAGAEERAGKLARLASRIVELESLEDQLVARTSELERLQEEMGRLRDSRKEDARRTEELDGRVRELEAALLERDRRINDLRQRNQEAVAELESARDEQRALRERVKRSEEGASGRQLREYRERVREAERVAAEARSDLRGQVERSRKQEALHQQIVANLRHELRDSGRDAGERASDPDVRRDPGVQRLIAEQDARIQALLQRVEEIESGGPEAGGIDVPGGAAGDVSGLGAELQRRLRALGITRLEQIAAWDRSDVERVAEQIGAPGIRSVLDEWVASAKRQQSAEGGGADAEPPLEDQGS